MKWRAVILILAAATAVRAQADDPSEPLGPADIERIDRLVGRLSARDSFLRTAAQRELAAYGPRVVPVLRAYDPLLPETRARIDGVLQQFECLELTARLVADAHAVGAPVLIRMELVNHTRQAHVIQIQQGALTPFRVAIAGDGRFLKRGAVTFTPQQTHEFVTVQPGQRIVAEVALEASELPRGEDGTIPIVVSYSSQHALRLAEEAEPREDGTVEGDAIRLTLVAPTLMVDLRRRTVEELEAELLVDAQRQRALVEIRFRDDYDIVPLLRRHARDEDLRLHAVHVLGAKGDAEDLDMIRRATRDPAAPVRKAATLALANFSDAKARQRLSLLARDEELRLEAVQALASHRSARTIDTYLALMKNRFREGEWAPVIRKTLLEWTGKDVRNTPSEIAAFERWWKDNRADWIRREDGR